MNEREFGVVVHWTDRGYGFIRSEGRDRDLFLHIDECDMPTGEEPRIGDRVSYIVGTDSRRDKPPRPCAKLVRFVDGDQAGDEPKPANAVAAPGMFARRDVDDQGTENALSEGLRKFIRDQQ
jgi:cold shock CspA family protein